MLIGACGLRWQRDLYKWNRVNQRRLLGRRKGARGKVRIADFSTARGIYVLHNPQGIYYVGLAFGDYGRMTGRLADHTTDKHADQWDRFSWFSFDEPSDEVDNDGIVILDDDWDDYGELGAREAVKDLEAILIAALAPPGNTRAEKFGLAEIWDQVANVRPPAVETLDDLRKRLE